MTEWCKFLIYKKIKLKMCNINTYSFKLIKYVKWVNVKIVNVIIFITLFIKNKCDNNLFLNYF